MLVAAARAVGARSHGVVVKVTAALGRLRAGGRAVSAYGVARWFVSGRIRNKGGKVKRGYVATDGGYITLTLPLYRPIGDPLAIAERVYTLALHEWAHVGDMQSGKPFGQYRRRWANRPHERRANNLRDEAIDKEAAGDLRSRDDLILDLGLWIEGQQQR